jgi:hypothetical protein
MHIARFQMDLQGMLGERHKGVKDRRFGFDARGNVEGQHRDTSSELSA